MIYICAAENGLFKIGKTTNIKNRMQQIKSASPIICFLVSVIEDSNSDKLEKQFHKRFADKRIRGEWFALSKDDLLLFLPETPDKSERIELLEAAGLFDMAAAQRKRRAREAREKVTK